MGAFNTVVIQDRDVALDQDVEVQFKHGLVRQFRYRVGDALRWPADRARTQQELEADVPGLARVGADRYVDYLVHIRRGVISDVERVRADPGAALPGAPSRGEGTERKGRRSGAG